MKNTKGLLARWGLAAALLLLGVGVARPASADVTIKISRAGSVSGGVATVSGTISSDVGEYVHLDVYPNQNVRGSLQAYGGGYWEGYVPYGQVTAWITIVYPDFNDGSVAFRIGPAAVYVQAYPQFSDYAEASGAVSLKKR